MPCLARLAVYKLCSMAASRLPQSLKVTLNYLAGLDMLMSQAKYQHAWPPKANLERPHAVQGCRTTHGTKSSGRTSRATSDPRLPLQLNFQLTSKGFSHDHQRCHYYWNHYYWNQYYWHRYYPQYTVSLCLCLWLPVVTSGPDCLP